MSISEATVALEADVLRDALETANIPTLVPLLFQLTGDRRWLAEAYCPTRPRGTDDHDDGGLSEEIQQEIRAATHAAVLAWDAGRPAAVPAPTGDTLLELARISVGEEVPAEYEAMTAEQMGFRPAPRPALTAPVPTGFGVLVIGAGISGMTASKHLRDLGIAHTVIEKNPRVGGTWIENRYPGCGVDTPSHLYSLSFFPREWSAYFGKRAELDDYLSVSRTTSTSRARSGSAPPSSTWCGTTRRSTGTCRSSRRTAVPRCWSPMP